MIKQIFSDMDGTLLDNAGNISDTNVKAIKKANLPFTLVSARAPMEMTDVMDKLALTAPQIGFNGGLIFERKNGKLHVIKESPIDLATAKDVYNSIRQHFPDVSLSWYTIDGWYSEKIDAGIEHEIDYTDLKPNIVNKDVYFNDPKNKVFKFMMIIFEPAVMKDVKKYLEDQNFPGISIQQSSDTYLEITSASAQKSQGIQLIIDNEKLQRSEMAAFGDGHNDLPMLKMVAHPIVMKNALPEVLEVAEFVTRSNVDDGVAYGIEKYLNRIS